MKSLKLGDGRWKLEVNSAYLKLLCFPLASSSCLSLGNLPYSHDYVEDTIVSLFESGL